MPTLSSAVNAPVRKLSLGIMTSTVTRESVLSVSMADPHGAVVTAVARNSAGDQAGLKYGDVIQTFNNHRVSGMEELDQYLSETAPGIPLTLGVWRRGQVIVVLFTQ
jgi:S1-C subfamily serine protease